MYKAKKHNLRWPIDKPNSKIDSVEFGLISVSDHKRMAKDYDQESKDFMRACVSFVTGISIDDLKLVVKPDYNSMHKEVLRILTKPSSDFADVGDHDSPKLINPIDGDGGVIETYKIKPPTVGVTDAMDVYETEEERTLYLCSTCTGLSVSELGEMSLPDWTHLQVRLIDFLQEAADYFPLKT